jgi:hypothetical protein
MEKHGFAEVKPMDPVLSDEEQVKITPMIAKC